MFPSNHYPSVDNPHPHSAAPASVRSTNHLSIPSPFSLCCESRVLKVLEVLEVLEVLASHSIPTPTEHLSIHPVRRRTRPLLRHGHAAASTPTSCPDTGRDRLLLLLLWARKKESEPAGLLLLAPPAAATLHLPAVRRDGTKIEYLHGGLATPLKHLHSPKSDYIQLESSEHPFPLPLESLMSASIHPPLSAQPSLCRHIHHIRPIRPICPIPIDPTVGLLVDLLNPISLQV